MAAVAPKTDGDHNLGTADLRWGTVYAGNIDLSGNLTVTGTVTNIETTNLQVVDPVIELNKNASDNSVDQGISAKYVSGGGTKYSVIFRDADVGEWKIYEGLTTRPVAAGTTVDLTDGSVGTICSNVKTDSIAGSTTNGDITITPDGSGNLLINAAKIRVGDANSDATITTNGTGDLTLSTNDGTNSGTIVIEDGADGDITLTSNGTGKVNIPTGFSLAGTTVTSTASELNILDGVTATASELNLVDGSTKGTIVNTKAVIYGDSGEVNATTLQVGGTAITATPAEINYLDNDDLTAADITKLAAVTATAAEINYLDNDDLTAADITKLAAVTATAAELNIMDGVTATAAELNIMDGVTATAAEINYLDNDDLTAADITKLAAVTATAAELNIMDGVTATAAEINYLDVTTLGTAQASKAVTVSAGSVIDFNSIDMTNVDINSGAIDGTNIGAQSRASAQFTTVDATGDVLIQGESNTAFVVSTDDDTSNAVFKVDTLGDPVVRVYGKLTVTGSLTSGDDETTASILKVDGGFGYDIDTTVTASATIDVKSHVTKVDTTAGAVVLTLPPISGAGSAETGQEFIIIRKKDNQVGGNLTIKPNTGDTVYNDGNEVDDTESITVLAMSTLRVFSDGENWYVV